MEKDAYDTGAISDDDSIYRYLRLRKEDGQKKDDGEWDGDEEKWDNYSLDDYNLDFPNFLAKSKSVKTVNLNSEKDSGSNLQEDSTASQSSNIEERLNMISQLKKLYEDQKQLKLKNSFLHKKCRDIFIKFKIMNTLERWGFDSEIHNDKRYIEILTEFKAFKLSKEETENGYERELKMLGDSYQLHSSEFRETFHGYTSREIEIGDESISRETKTITKAPFMSLLNKQKQRLDILSQERVKYFKLENSLDDIQGRLDNRNILGGGYTIIKYENLMMNKNALMEKIDECVKELERIREKFFSLVHILAHVREVSVGVAHKIEQAEVKSVELGNSARENRVELSRRRQLIKKQRLEINHPRRDSNL